MTLIFVFQILFSVLSAEARGVLLLTFDDRHFDSWTNAIPIFSNYNAHATFFPCGTLNEDDLIKLADLKKNGHSVGLHSVGHKKVPPSFNRILGNWRFYRSEILPLMNALRGIGIKPKSFSYPYNDCNNETDEFLSRWYSRYRSAHLNGYATNGVSIVSYPNVFIPADKINDTKNFKGVGIGKYYHTNIDDICAGITHAATNGLVLCLFSHGIYEDAANVDMDVRWLRKILRTATENDMAIKGFDEL